MKGAIVLDSSALLALLFREPGAEKVLPYLENSIMSTVNILEVATIMQMRGIDLNIAEAEIGRLLAASIPLETPLAFKAAKLVTSTKNYGLSLGDRVCLALAQEKKLPVLTADKIWQKLDIEVEVRIIR